MKKQHDLQYQMLLDIETSNQKDTEKYDIFNKSPY